MVGVVGVDSVVGLALAVGERVGCDDGKCDGAAVDGKSVGFIEGWVDGFADG